MTSIYRPKHSVMMPEADLARRAPMPGAVAADAHRESDAGEDWAGRRKAQPANVVLPSTRRWMNSLPELVETNDSRRRGNLAYVASCILVIPGPPADEQFNPKVV